MKMLDAAVESVNRVFGKGKPSQYKIKINRKGLPKIEISESGPDLSQVIIPQKRGLEELVQWNKRKK